MFDDIPLGAMAKSTPASRRIVVVASVKGSPRKLVNKSH